MDSVGCPILSMRLCAHLGVRFVSGFVLSQSQSCQHLGGGARAMALRPKASLLSSEPRTPLPPGPTLIGGHHLSLLQRAGGLWDVSQDWELDGGGGKGSAQAQLSPQGGCELLLSPLPPALPPPPRSHLSRLSLLFLLQPSSPLCSFPLPQTSPRQGCVLPPTENSCSLVLCPLPA